MRRALLLLLALSCNQGTATFSDKVGDTDITGSDKSNGGGVDTLVLPADTAYDSGLDTGYDSGWEPGDYDEDGWTVDEGDCNDADPTIHPFAPEICDNVDQNCDNILDEGTDCTDDDGDGVNDQGGDCNDNDNTIFPGAVEIRDGIDQNCNGLIDDGTTAWDDDGDCSCEVAPCRGSVSPNCGTLTGNDCNDTRSDVFPGAVEACNGRDDNCVAGVDEPGATGGNIYYLDGDGDGYGVPQSTVNACSPPQGYATNNTDCYDGNAAAHPGATDFHPTHRGDGSFDYDCDTKETKQYTGNYTCTGGCWGGSSDGWASGSAPACGVPANLSTGCDGIITWPFCRAHNTSSTPQGCR